MRVIKTLSKQLELAEQGNLYIIANCAYVKVSTEHVLNSQGHNVKFYGKVK